LRSYCHVVYARDIHRGYLKRFGNGTEIITFTRYGITCRADIGVGRKYYVVIHSFVKHYFV